MGDVVNDLPFIAESESSKSLSDVNTTQPQKLDGGLFKTMDDRNAIKSPQPMTLK